MANKCKRGILISKTPYEKRIAIMEDGELVELVVEGVSSNRVLGNIYKGVVQKVLPALKAAFIDIGLEKAGFLHQEDAMDNSSAANMATTMTRTVLPRKSPLMKSCKKARKSWFRWSRNRLAPRVLV